MSILKCLNTKTLNHDPVEQIQPKCDYPNTGPDNLLKYIPKMTKNEKTKKIAD